MRKPGQQRLSRELQTSAFSLTEALVVVMVLGIVGVFAFRSIGGSVDEEVEVALESKVAMVNTVVQAYLANGGDLIGLEDAQSILDRLKAPGMTSRSMVDPRLAVRLMTAGEAESRRARAIWNPEELRFELRFAGYPAVGEFLLDEKLAAVEYVAPEGENETSDFEESDPLRSEALEEVTTTKPMVVAEEPEAPSASPWPRLDETRTWETPEESVRPGDFLPPLMSPDSGQWISGSIRGEFQAAQGSESMVYAIRPMEGGSELKWGETQYSLTETNELGQSEEQVLSLGPQNCLQFQGAGFQRVLAGTRFQIGTLTYFNGSNVTDTEVTSVLLELLIDVEGTDGGQLRLQPRLDLQNTVNDEDAWQSADYVQLPDGRVPVRSGDGEFRYIADLEFGKTSEEGFSTADEFHVFESGTASVGLWATFHAQDAKENDLMQSSRVEPMQSRQPSLR